MDMVNWVLFGLVCVLTAVLVPRRRLFGQRLGAARWIAAGCFSTALAAMFLPSAPRGIVLIPLAITFFVDGMMVVAAIFEAGREAEELQRDIP